MKKRFSEENQWRLIKTMIFHYIVLFSFIQQVFVRNRAAMNALATIRDTTITYYFTTTWLEKVKDVLFVYFLHNYIFSPFLNTVYGYGIIRTLRFVYNSIVKYVTSILFKLPFIKKKIEKEINDTKRLLQNELIVKADSVDHHKIPTNGLSKEEVMNQLDSLSGLKAVDWKDGKVSGAVYHGGGELIQLQTDAIQKFAVSNQLHPDAFPGVRQMESEVVSMVLNLFNAPPDTGCGTTSSGGTESLLLACLAARERGRIEKGITNPEIVAPKTIHAAIFKAAKYFNMKLNLADLNDDFTGDIGHMKRLINKNTVIILGSAANFPYGTIDNIPELSKLAVKYDIPLHVDCCLGSFVIAFYEKAIGKPLPFAFDFRLPGVTSISCDTHKYGFAPKGSSVILYRSPDYRKYQYYISSDWVGGLYGSPTLAGSRPGALTVGAWATMIYLGEDGYIKQIKAILEAAQKLRNVIETEIDELDLIGDPLLSVVSFKSSVINVHALGDMLSKKYGWHLSSLQQPAALHLAVTKLSVPAIDKLTNDLKICVAHCVELIKTNGPDSIKSDTAQLYGVAESISTRGVVDELVGCFLDALYKTDKDE